MLLLRKGISTFRYFRALTITFISLFVLLQSSVVLAADVDVTNDTGFDIYYLYISHEDSDEWEEDVLGDDILEDGDSIHVDIEGYSSSVFDVKAEDEDGDEYYIYGVNIKKSDIVLTIDDLDVDGTFEGYIEVTNDTGFDIYYLYVSHEDSDDWEEDVLGDDILEDGDTFRIDVEGYRSSMFDVKAEDEDGDEYTIFGIDVEVDDLTLTLDHLD